MIVPTDTLSPRIWTVSTIGNGQLPSRSQTLRGESFSHWKRSTRCILNLSPFEHRAKTPLLLQKMSYSPRLDRPARIVFNCHRSAWDKPPGGRGTYWIRPRNTRLRRTRPDTQNE